MVRRALRRIFLHTGYVCTNIGRKLSVSATESNVLAWHNARGDKTLRLNYQLDHHSIVFDLGGYEGQWSSDIFAKYCCYIYVFEPVEEYAGFIGERFKNNPKIKVYNHGLAERTGTAQLTLAQDSSSIYKKSDHRLAIKLVDIIEFFQINNLDRVDLMKINIEGAEYDLLEYLVNTEYIRKIKNIQVQFHDFVPNAGSRMNDIQDVLRESHVLTYQYPFVWENWALKNS